jgi:FtsP/CotA-like multicopper oxidase with cupredoxin domain
MVHNALEREGISLHWHGLHMRGSNNMDGAVGFTQSPIPAGASFVYHFWIGLEQHGTFWYHAHSHVQRGDGLYGGLVVHQEALARNKIPYEQDMLLLVGDWFHRSAEEMLAWYTSTRGFGNEVSGQMLKYPVCIF